MLNNLFKQPTPFFADASWCCTMPILWAFIIVFIVLQCTYMQKRTYLEPWVFQSLVNCDTLPGNTNITLLTQTPPSKNHSADPKKDHSFNQHKTQFVCLMTLVEQQTSLKQPWGEQTNNNNKYLIALWIMDIACRSSLTIQACSFTQTWCHNLMTL